MFNARVRQNKRVHRGADLTVVYRLGAAGISFVTKVEPPFPLVFFLRRSFSFRNERFQLVLKA